MGRAERPTLRGTPLGGVLRLWNPAMRRLLASPLHRPLSRWFGLLEYSGRRSGRAYRTPVSYVREGRVVFVTTADRWRHNVSGGADVRILLRGRWHRGRAVAVTGRDESIGEHARLFRSRPFFRRLAGIPAGPRGGPDPAMLARSVDAGRTLVRIELAD